MSKIKAIIPKQLRKYLKNTFYFVRNIFLLFTPYLRTKTYQGITLYYNRGNSIIERLRSEPIFEAEMSKKIAQDLQADETPTFLDVGANLGLILANVLNDAPNTKVYAFEPGPRQAELLTMTVVHNNLSDHVKIETCALSDKSGTQSFFTHKGKDIAKDGLLDTGRGESTVEICVNTNTLDRWWKDNSKLKVSVVKIDTEGAELKVLHGAKEFISAIKPIIYLEIAESNLKAYPYTAKDILVFFESIGYVLETLHGIPVSQESISSFLENHDTFRAFYDEVG